MEYIVSSCHTHPNDRLLQRFQNQPFGFCKEFCTFLKCLSIKSLQKSHKISQMPPFENVRSCTLTMLIFHKTLISNMLCVLIFSQIDFLFSPFRTLAKNAEVPLLIIRHFQVTKIVNFRKSCKKKRLFHHFRKFSPLFC